MIDEERLSEIRPLLEKRSGLDISDALIFNADYLTYWEKIYYKFEIEYLLEYYDVEEDVPF